MVAKRILGGKPLIVRQLKLMDFLSQTMRNGQWVPELSESTELIFELPPLLSSRPHVRRMLRKCLKDRTERGFRTVVLEAEDYGSTQAIMRLTDFKHRALLILRFPEGRGRYRFAAKACVESGVPTTLSKRLGDIPDWTYEKMFAELNIIQATHMQSSNGDTY